MRALLLAAVVRAVQPLVALAAEEVGRAVDERHVDPLLDAGPVRLSGRSNTKGATPCGIAPCHGSGMQLVRVYHDQAVSFLPDRPRHDILVHWHAWQSGSDLPRLG